MLVNESPQTFPEVPEGNVDLRPSVFYRREHPDYFSDTTEVAEPELPKDLLVFHLDQLTASKKEREFEDFCRRLAEHEICPNLMPQTGPSAAVTAKPTVPLIPSTLNSPSTDGGLVTRHQLMKTGHLLSARRETGVQR